MAVMLYAFRLSVKTVCLLAAFLRPLNGKERKLELRWRMGNNEEYGGCFFISLSLCSLHGSHVGLLEECSRNGGSFGTHSCVSPVL